MSEGGRHAPSLAEIAADLRRQIEVALDVLTTLETGLVTQSTLPEDWISTEAAASRFDLPIDTVRWMAREKGCGRKNRGRWQVSASAIRRYRKQMALALNAKQGPF